MGGGERVTNCGASFLITHGTGHLTPLELPNSPQSAPRMCSSTHPLGWGLGPQEFVHILGGGASNTPKSLYTSLGEGWAITLEARMQVRALQAWLHSQVMRPSVVTCTATVITGAPPPLDANLVDPVLMWLLLVRPACAPHSFTPHARPISARCGRKTSVEHAECGWVGERAVGKQRVGSSARYGAHVT